MTRGPLPRFSARGGLSGISASAMNRLVDVLENAERRLVEVERRTLSSGDFERDTPRPKMVAVTKPPVEGDAMLAVRAAGYATIPPKKCEGDPRQCYYEWLGANFDAYPSLGSDVMDYEGKAFASGQPPAFDTVFYRCQFQNGVWVLDRPGGEGGGGITPARVLPTPGTGNRTIAVQPVKRIVPPPSNPASAVWTNDGPPIDAVALWGEQRGEDFQTVVNDIIPLIEIAGEKYAMQYFWFYTKTVNSAIPRGDCGL